MTLTRTQSGQLPQMAQDKDSEDEMGVIERAPPPSPDGKRARLFLLTRINIDINTG